MLERFKSAGAVLALTVAMGLPIPGLEAADKQTNPTEEQVEPGQAKPAQAQAKPAQARDKPPETQAKTEEPQPTTKETVPEARETAPSDGMKAFDAVAVRPVTFISSIFSTGAFVLALPFAAFDPAMDVEKTRKNLVEEPFQDTFQRPLGDLNAFGETRFPDSARKTTNTGPEEEK